MEMGFHLRERTVLLMGQSLGFTQHLAQGLTQFGADVVFLHHDTKMLSKFASHLSDSREINSKFGRGAAVEANTKSPAALKDAISRCAEPFGGIDIFIDTNFSQMATPAAQEITWNHFDDLLTQNLVSSLTMSHLLMPYLKTRKRGRILFFTHLSAITGSASDSVFSALRSGLVSYSKCLAHELASWGATANVLAIGPTEEYLLAHYPECSTIKEALEKHRTFDPQAKLVENDKVTNAALFLIGPQGIGMNGQTLEIT